MYREEYVPSSSYYAYTDGSTAYATENVSSTYCTKQQGTQKNVISSWDIFQQLQKSQRYYNLQ